jgi:hypothetical protein
MNNKEGEYFIKKPHIEVSMNNKEGEMPKWEIPEEWNSAAGTLSI